MARERCFKKSFKDSLEDIKERMKEKRNQKWAKLGKPSQVLSVKGKVADNSSMHLKSLQANNQGLALALEEERRKMREAQDIILHLKKEYQHLKFQMFVLQRKLELQQEKEYAETKFVALKKIVLQAIQLLLEATNLLNPEHNASTSDPGQRRCASVHEECDADHLRTQDSLALLKHVLAGDISKQDNTFRPEMENKKENNYSDFVSDCCQRVENTSPAIIPQTSTDWRSNSHKNRNISSEVQDRQADNPLPKSVSTRRRCFKTQNELSISDSNHSEIPKQLKEHCQQDRPETGLEYEELGNEQYEETNPGQENKCDVNTNYNLKQSDMQIELCATAVDPKQMDFHSVGDSQTQNKRYQKRKLETMKRSSRMQSKRERSRSKQSCSKEMADKLAGSRDAYDFIFAEGVHVTPFRQNKENENNMNDKEHVETIEIPSSDSFTSQEDSDDSLYVPYTKKSKCRKSLNCTNDASPVHTRPRLKKITLEQCDRDTEGKNKNAKKSEKFMDVQESTDKSSACEAWKNSHSNATMKVDDIVPCLAVTVVEKKKKQSKSSFTEHSNFEKDEPFEALQASRLHLGDITNLTSSTRTTISHPSISTDAKDTSHRSRRCTVSVSYKEPSLSGKLRRGDPFTDTGFLNSPIFKDKKSSKHKSVKKKSLSRYNEAFIGCFESL
ncbi:shugoshin 1 [Tiliqua scincoides]|uniref:shugoshin 1 n=1 Tax=Tiliqua scincoides TaxID=71010 RepID=UPI003461C10B